MHPSRSADARQSELNVVPMMNLFVVLVPLLLLSAVFVQVSAIDLATSGDTPADATAGDGPPTITVTEHDVRLARDAASPDHARIDRSTDDVFARLEAALLELRPRVAGDEIVIASAGGVRYQDLISVIDAAAGAGFAGYSLAGFEGE